MVFLFNDKHCSLKHLSFIIESKIIADTTLKLKELIGDSLFSSDILQYSDNETMIKDIKRLKNALKKHTELMHDIQRKQPMGFVNAVGEESEEYEEDDE